MNKINTTAIAVGAAMPYQKTMIDFLNDGNNINNQAILQCLLGTNSTSGYYCLSGCEISGSGTFTIQTGYVILASGEIVLAVGNVITPSVGQVIVGTVGSFYTTGYDPVTFSNGTTNNVHEQKVINWSAGTSGSANFDYDDVVFLQNPTRQVGTIATAQWDNGSGSTDFKYYKIPFNKLVIDTTLEKLSAGSATIITLPSGYRPAYNRYFTTFGGTVNPDTILTFKIDTGGAITLFNSIGTLTLGGGDVYTIYAEIPLF